ncbi:MAG: hypothetical protein COB07_10375 [Sulfurovum sp.]|nr:MAG: hypothetical protein COB07_10375 [Sulfurovum sp.]
MSFLFLSVLVLHAEDFAYTFKVDKPHPYVKEAVLLTLDLDQTNHDKVLLFDFKIKQSDAYRFQRLDIKETDTGHHAQVHYMYLIYPLKSGKININFDLLKKVTTEDSVAYSFSGDRDNVKGLVTVDTAVTLPPLEWEVKALPEGTKLVGDFTLTAQIKQHKAKAHEPLPFQISIQGKGYPPVLPTLLPEEGNFTRFTEKPVIHSVVSRQGTQSTVTYSMALSHSQSFTLPPVEIKAFNPQNEKSYRLTVPPQHFEISKAERSVLLDKNDSPRVLEADWSWLKTLLGYLVVFAAGYLTALSWKWRKKSTKGVTSPLVQKVQNCKDEKALLQVLMAADHKDFGTSIEKLEASYYGEVKINLKNEKQKILEQIQ